MASHPSANSSPDDYNFPHPRFPAGPPSIISSRMTDIASEDGDGNDTTQNDPTGPQRRSLVTDSRPGTAKTGLSSQRGAWSNRNSFRKGGQRGSIVGRNDSISGSSLRAQSSASRSHVPSLTSHAFFHPMSSQKLQAQRNTSRPPTTTQNRTSLQGDAVVDPPNVAEQQQSPTASSPKPIAHLTRQPTYDGDGHPPSRGTENTEPETYDRITANTSPTQGHYPTASLSESVRPLQRKKAEDMGLKVDIDRTRSYSKHVNNVPTPGKSPRSFRSNFLMPGKPEGTATPHDMHGVEKLPSGASTPNYRPSAHNTTRVSKASKAKISAEHKAANLGRNFEYFEGNTVFCLGGRFQNTRSRPINIATGVLVALPAALFFAFSAPYLWHHVSPAVPLVFAYIFYICMSSFIRASVTDPGVCNHGSQSSHDVMRPRSDMYV